MIKKSSKKQESSTKEKSIREYVYLDETEVNSVLAQLKDGIPKVIRRINQTTSESTQTDGKSDNYKAGAKGGFHLLAEANGEYQHQSSHQNHVGSSDMSQNAIDTVYSDHAIDIIEKELDEMGLMKAHTKQPDGKFVKLTQKFNIMDFDSLKKFTTNKSIQELINDPDFDEFETAAIAIQELYPNTVFVKLNSSIVIGDESNFRYNKTQLQTINFSSRKLTVIGRVETVLTPTIINKIEKPLSDFSENSEKENSEKENSDIGKEFLFLGKIVPIFSMYFLRALFDLKTDDRVIKPIAMYFE